MQKSERKREKPPDPILYFELNSQVGSKSWGKTKPPSMLLLLSHSQLRVFLLSLFEEKPTGQPSF